MTRSRHNCHAVSNAGRCIPQRIHGFIVVTVRNTVSCLRDWELFNDRRICYFIEIYVKCRLRCNRWRNSNFHWTVRQLAARHCCGWQRNWNHKITAEWPKERVSWTSPSTDQSLFRYRNESFQSITCTGTDNQTRKTKHNTTKTEEKTIE